MLFIILVYIDHVFYFGIETTYCYSYVYSHDGIMSFDRGFLICLLSESNGPNLLDEPLKGFIVNPAYSP